jgi:hypothetical protein
MSSFRLFSFNYLLKLYKKQIYFRVRLIYELKIVKKFLFFQRKFFIDKATLFLYFLVFNNVSNELRLTFSSILKLEQL